MRSWGDWASRLASRVEKRAMRAVAEFSTSSRTIHPKLVAVPATNAATSAVTFQPFTYAPAAVFWQGAAPTVMNEVRSPLAGLFTAVPKGWLFQVTTVSVHDAPTLKMSSVRHTAGIAVTYS